MTQDLDKAEERVEKQYKNAKGKGSEKRKQDAIAKARQEVLNKYLKIGPGANQKGRFADPASLVRG